MRGVYKICSQTSFNLGRMVWEILLKNYRNGKEERHVKFLRRIQLTQERQQDTVVKPQERRQENSRKKDEKTVIQELKCVNQA